MLRRLEDESKDHRKRVPPAPAYHRYVETHDAMFLRREKAKIIAGVLSHPLRHVNVEDGGHICEENETVVV